jgi:hypothetical protein
VPEATVCGVEISINELSAESVSAVANPTLAEIAADAIVVTLSNNNLCASVIIEPAGPAGAPIVQFPVAIIIHVPTGKSSVKPVTGAYVLKAELDVDEPNAVSV